MSNNQINKGNQKGGAQDQRRRKNETGNADTGEQARNEKRHLQQDQGLPRGEGAASKAPAGTPTGK